MIGRRILTCFALVCLLWSCKNQTRQPSKTSAGQLLVDQYHDLGSRSQVAWTRMMNSDRTKFDNMRRLVSELKLVDGSDHEALDRIVLKINTIDSVRYTRAGISDSKAIDRFDAVTNDIWSALRSEVTKTEKASAFQIISNILIPEIQQADDSVLFYRKDYDRSVDSLNLFLKQNRKALRKEVPGVDTLKPLPVFRMVQ